MELDLSYLKYDKKIVNPILNMDHFEMLDINVRNNGLIDMKGIYVEK